MGKKAKFVLFGQSRSGSTLLVDLLNSHSQIRCEGEIFSPQSWETGFRKPFFKVVQKYPEAYLRYKTLNAGNSLYGFKLLDHQLPEINNFIKTLGKKGWIIIRLHRKNIFKMAISNLIASKTNKWSTDHGDKLPQTSVFIDKYRFCDIISWTNFCQKRIDESLVGVTHYEVTYENDLEEEKNWSKTMDKLFGLLQIESMAVKSKYTKTDQRPYSERIENYDELVGIAHSLNLKID